VSVRARLRSPPHRRRAGVTTTRRAGFFSRVSTVYLRRAATPRAPVDLDGGALPRCS